MGTDNIGSVTGSKKYENVIKQIRGVVAVRVVLDNSGDFEEIHVLASAERSPKQIVRDIETVIMVAFGITLDHKKISVVQIPEENLKISTDNWRPRLLCINTSITRSKVNVTVQLAVQEKTVEGTAAGPHSPLNRMRMVAAAILDALEKVFQGKISLSVDQIAKVNFNGTDIIVVSVFMVTSEGEDVLLGSAFITGNEAESIGKATLGAINRKLSSLPQIQP